MTNRTTFTRASATGNLQSLVTNYNANLDTLEVELENSLSRKDNILPNSMEDELDMNGNDIINVNEIDVLNLTINGTPVQPSAGVTVGQAFQSYTFTATLGQTSFSVAPYTPYVTSVQVEVNGLSLPPADISVSGTNVIIPACTAGDEVVIHRYTVAPSPLPVAEDITFNQAGTVNTRSVQNKLRDTVSVKDFGAVGDGATECLPLINSAIAAKKYGEIYVPSGEYKTTGFPTNPNGVKFVGDGKILVPETGGYQQINTYGDNGYLVGKEYLYRAYARLQLGPAGASAQLKIYVYGDSTVEGYVAPPSTMDGNFLVQNLLPFLFNQQGLHNVSVTNNGVSGTKWSDLNAIPNLAATTDLLIIKYGINDGVPISGETLQDRLDRLATAMRTKLAAIRAATFGDLTNCSILLVGPNSTNDTPNGRNEEWYEQVRNIYIKAARDYNCAYFDTYAYLRDSRKSALLWMDNPFGGNSSVHPLAMMNAWIWGAVVESCFPKAECAPYATNNFLNIGSAAQVVASTKPPSDYKYGMTWELGTIAQGFPSDGIVVTYRNPDTYAVQHLHPLAGTGRSFTRFASSGSAWGSFWTGTSVSLTLSNSWVVSTAPDTAAYAVRAEDGTVIMGGAIKNGTTTAFTLIATLPANYRPATYEYAYCASTTATPVLVRIDPDGSVYLLSTGDATRTSFTGIQFKAA